MTISERILKVLKDRNMTQVEFAKQVGIAGQPRERFTPYDIQLIEDYHGLKEEQQKRLVTYMKALQKLEQMESIVEE